MMRRWQPIPASALGLGLGGLIPFAVGAAMAWLVPGVAAVGEPVATGLVFYGAVILSFLGGTHWGLASAAIAGPPRPILVASVVPALIGWLACFLSLPLALALLAVAFALVLILDWRVSRDELAPGWWWRLRLGLTLAVVLLLGLALAGYLRGGYGLQA
jgi:hypothetical protein